MKITVYNLGCKVNKYECDGLLRLLKERGHEVSEDLVYADLYILNTCAVTNEAERKSRQCVSRCLRLNPQAKIVVCGCASQNDPDRFAEKDGVTYVAGNADKDKLVDRLEEKGIVIADLPTRYEDVFSPEVVRTRAYVKIQDGCDNYCSYCLIPYVRGRSRSRSSDSVAAECARLAESCKEIVLTGIDISSYGKNTGEDLPSLIYKIKDVDCRIRLGSLEVSAIEENFLIALRLLKKFCPQFHLSLQSGEDGVLKKMNRHYTTAQYAEKVSLIRRYFPDAAITTDLICGFPLESEESFESTLKFMDKIGFSQVHVFGYSPREGTVAARYKLLPADVVKERCARAAAVAEKCRDRYIESFVGRYVEVLSEDIEDGYMSGYSREYIRCRFDGGQSDKLYKVRIVKAEDGVAYAERVAD